MKITVIGTGYVGLVSGACLAEFGNDVLCLDLDADKVHILEDGVVPIFEPGLEDIVRRNMNARRLHFTADIEKAVAHGTIQFIAVGTPSEEDGSADIQSVIAAARNIGKYMTDYKVVVNKSTVPVGTADKVGAVIAEELAKRKEDITYSIVSNPEFLKEGTAVADFMRPKRIVIGANEEKSIQLMRTLYAPFQLNHDRLILMDVHSAELTKYAANSMLATRISFMNDLANLAEKIGANIELVRRGIGSDPRIGYDFLYAGCGYGGSCFPKDVNALIKTAADHDYDMKILKAVEEVNNLQKHILTKKIKSIFGNDLTNRHFALWGLAFKPNTDDMRQAPSRKLIDDLITSGATVAAYDPVAMSEADRIYSNQPQFKVVNLPMAALDNADALIIVTEWKEFRVANLELIKARLKTPIIVDGRNLYDMEILKEAGFIYHSIGRIAIT